MKKTLFKTEFLNLMAAKREGAGDWVYAKRPNVSDVAIIAPVLYRKTQGVVEKSTIFLLTKRPPLIEEYGEKFCVEFPAGLVGDEVKGETTLEAVNKELLEETGYRADKVEIQTAGLVSSGGLTNEKSTLVIAHIFDTKLKAQPVDDGGVIVSRKEVLLSQIPKFLKNAENEGNFLSAQTLAGVYYLKINGLF